ncbi:MAG: aminotransferase DegT [Candidatus Omnitrophica bacterium CG1_02_49_16]|nr:MAG: aminotransferase DegT [Candidatus Omnitrophica bacterium CG1_02_49_16]
MQHLSAGLDLGLVFEAIRGCLPPDRKSFELHEPVFNGNEWKYTKECLDSGWVSSVGKYVDVFEQKLSEYTGVRRAFVVVNGTAALHIALKMASVEINDEVLVPDLTFVATANAVTYCGAIPHFVDSEESTLGVDPGKLKAELKTISEVRSEGCFNKKTGRRITALIAMHTFGHPVDLEPLVEICRQFKLELIEDAAESLGSLYKGKHTGHWGKFAVLSFNGNKIVTTGGGGAILTDDEKLGKLAKHIATTAKIPHAWAFNHDQIGYNYRMPNINAALGLAQLEQLPGFIEHKRALAARYKKAFENIPGVRFFDEPKFAKSNFWLNAILLDKEHQTERDSLLALLNKNGIKARPAWTLMHKLPMYKDCPRMEVPVAESLEARLINIPSSAFL